MTSVFLFDFDGVILDSFEDTYRRFKPVFDELEIAFTKDTLRDLFLENVHAGASKFMTEEQIQYLNEKTLNDIDITRLHLYDHIEVLLNELERKGELIIISSNFEQHIKWSLEHHGVLPDVEILGHETHRSKVEKILSVKKRFPDANFVYVGDTVGDMREATRAGVQSVAVTWGYHTREMLQLAQPDYIVDTVEELRTVLSGLF